MPWCLTTTTVRVCVFSAAPGAVNNISIDTDERLLGSASLRVAVPADGFTGGFFTVNQGRDVSGYNALSFWAKTERDPNKILDFVSIGQAPLATQAYRAGIEDQVILTTEWQQFILPIPDPSELTALKGLFYFAEQSGRRSAYTIWFDDIRYVNLNPGIVSKSRGHPLPPPPRIVSSVIPSRSPAAR